MTQQQWYQGCPQKLLFLHPLPALHAFLWRCQSNMMILSDPVLETWLSPPPLEMPAFSLGPQRSAYLTMCISGQCRVAPYMVQVCARAHLRAHLHPPSAPAGGRARTPALQRKSLLFREARRTSRAQSHSMARPRISPFYTSMLSKRGLCFVFPPRPWML